MIPTQGWLVLGSFALTYLVHSTVLFLFVWSLERAGKLRAVGLREALWRVVLFGALVTAIWPVASSREPWLGRVALAIQEQPTNASEARRPALPAEERGTGARPAAVEVAERESAASREALGTLAARSDPMALSAAAPSIERVARRSWITLGFVLALTLLALVPRIRLRLWLGERVPITEGALLGMLGALRRSSGMRRRVRLTASGRIASPIAFGILRPEICMPARALGSPLEPELARAMLAHELAHLARFDPLWLALGELAGRLLFFQPLARAAQRRLVHLAELACDRRAVRLTNDPLALARSLAEVATWIHLDRPRALCAMARARSRLEERVQCLLAPPAERERRGLRWIAAASVAASAALALPALALEHARAPLEAEPGLSTLRAEHSLLARSIADLAEQIGRFSGSALLPEEQEHLEALAMRADRLVRLAREIEDRIAEQASAAPDENTHR